MVREHGLSFKAFVIGTGGVVFACSSSVYFGHAVSPGDLAGDWFPFGAAITFLLILFGLNPLLRAIHRPLELTRVELLLVFIMVFVATPLSTVGFATPLVTHLCAPLFDMSPSNDYWARLGQYLPLWLYPDDTRAVVWFYEGLPPGESLPWGAWLSPLAYWSVVFIAICGLITSLVAIMRKQWVENERLVFPMMEVPLALVEDYEKGRRLPPIMRRPLFWFGAGLVILVYGTYILNHYNPAFPRVRLFGSGVLTLNFASNWRELRLHLFPAVLCFSFLVKRDILLSVWVFGLLIYFQHNIMQMVGYSAGTTIRNEEIYDAALAWECLGGLFVFVLVGLFMARRHLREVVRKAVWNDPTIDDSDEPMRYRTAGIVFLLSFLTLEVFFVRMGMTPTIATLVIATLIVFNLAVTRFVIEGGFVLCRPSAPIMAVVIGLFGAKNMPLACLAALTACSVFNSDFRTGVMPALANSTKLVEGIRLRRGTLLKAVVWALAIGSVVSVVCTLLVVYDVGGTNSQNFMTRFVGNRPFRSGQTVLTGITEPSADRIGWGSVGVAIMAVLTVGRYNLAWWPLHPIGFPVGIAAVVWGFQASLFSVFVAWLAKSGLLRLGGAPLYAKAKPFFIGLLVGQIIIVAIGCVYNLLHGAPGVDLILG